MEVDVVLGGELLDRAAGDIGRRLVVANDQLDPSAHDATGSVYLVDCHLHPDERALATVGGDPGQRLHRAELIGLGLAKRAPPRPRQYCRAEPDGTARRRRPEHSAARDPLLAIAHPKFLPCSTNGVSTR